MATIKKITVQSKEITVLLSKGGNDYICLTDMIRGEGGEDHIRNWMRNKDTVEYLGVWESIHNPNFKGVEFDTFLKEAGFNRFNLTPRKWIDATNAIGLVSKPGRNGGTYAHKDIAFNFGMWLSPTFQLYVVKEYQRLIERENNPLLLHWDAKRLLSKVNYAVHTDAIKDYIIPRLTIGQTRKNISNIYAGEADMLNLALFGYTAKDWELANPGLAKRGLNMRDMASINQLILLSAMEAYNSEMIKDGKPIKERFLALHKMAKEQIKSLDRHNAEQRFRKLAPKDDSPELE